MARVGLAFFGTAFLASCTTILPNQFPDTSLKPVTFAGSVQYSSSRSAVVRLRTAFPASNASLTIFGGGKAGPIIPVFQPPGSIWDFGPLDEFEFAESLQSELERLKLFKHVDVKNPDQVAAEAIDPSKASPTAYPKIDLEFASAWYSRDGVFYTLDVLLLVPDGKPISRKYHIDSRSKDSVMDFLTMRPSDAKQKVCRLLMEKLVPDIEEWVKENPESGG
jgi:hypothetical protein